MPDTATKLDRTSLQLTIPAEAALLRIVRLVASGVASYTDLDLDTVEGVRVGADELVSALIRTGAGNPVTLELALDGNRLRVDAETSVTVESFELDPLTDRILREVTTSHSFRLDDGVLRGHIEVSLPD